jgi:cytochrome P450
MTTPTTDLYYDPYDYEVDVHAQEVWKRMRDERPAYWNDKYSFYALSRFDDVLGATLDLDTFSSAHGTTIELMTEEPNEAFMIWMDPPKHTHFRKLVNRAFTPRRIGDLEHRIERLCAHFLDPFIGEDGFDYVDQFAAVLPPTVILALLGFPEGQAEEWRSGIDRMFHMEQGEAGFASQPTTNPDQLVEDGGTLGSSLFTLLPELMEERRSRPQEDLISTLVNTELEDEDGTTRPLSDMEFFGFIQLLAIAGTETVARLLSWVAVLLARNPEQRALLVEDPSLVTNGVEEILRYEAPSPVNARWVTRDVECHGETMPRGSKVILLNGSANRDERHFPDADQLDVRRHIDRNLAFGYGAHFCIGAALARLEGRIALAETLKRFPTWEIDESALEWVHTSTVRGFAKVPIYPR